MEATYPFSSFPTPNSTPTPTPTPALLHIPPILPAVPQGAPTIKQPNHTIYIILTYVALLAFFIYIVRHIFKARRENSDANPVPQLDESVPPPPQRQDRDEGAVLRFLINLMHILLSHYVNGFTSAFAGIALNKERFRIQFLPNYSYSIANHKNTNPICYFVDGRVLMLSIIYEVAGIIGLMLFVALSRRLSLRWMGLVHPSAHLIGAIMCATSTNLWTLTVGRFFMGLAPSFADQVNARLLKEFAPERGKSVLEWCNGHASSIGSIAAYSVAFFASSRLLRTTLIRFLSYPLLGLIIICIVLASQSANRTPITIGQLKRAAPLIPLRMKHQALTSALGLDVLMQYIPQYITFVNVKSGQLGYLASLCVSLATAASMVSASVFKLGRFGRTTLSFVVFMGLVCVGVVHVLLDRLSTPISHPHHPRLMIVVTALYCAVTGISKIDLEMLKSPDDVGPVISILNRALAGVVNIIILLSVSYMGCILQFQILGWFAVCIVCIYALCSTEL